MTASMNRLRGVIRERGLTQQEVSEKLGIDPSTFYRKLASGGLAFTIGEMHRLADILQLTPEESAQIFLK
jgi:putative phage repressor